MPAPNDLKVNKSDTCYTKLLCSCCVSLVRNMVYLTSPAPPPSPQKKIAQALSSIYLGTTRFWFHKDTYGGLSYCSSDKNYSVYTALALARSK